MANTFSKEFSISSFDLNPKGLARLTTIANFFQEMAYHHAGQLGFGYDDMNERHTMWVLSRMKIRINRYPVWGDQVKVETWHRGMDRLFGLRDFRVLDDDGNVLGIATTAWLILDSRTKRPVRTGVEVLNHSQGDKSVFEGKLEKIDLPDDLEVKSRRRVQFSDLDIMGHVNNVKYMEWCIDTDITEIKPERDIRELEINFMHEALLEDLMVISGSNRNDGNSGMDSFLVARREGDGQEIVRTRLRWDQNPL